MASSVLKVPVQTLQDCIDKVNGFAQDNTDIFDKLLNSLRCLKGSGEWVGASADAVIIATEKNKKQFADVLEELSSLAEYMSTFLKELEKEDVEKAQKIRASVST